MNLSNISFEINIFDDSEILKSQVQKDSLHEYILRENHSVISNKKSSHQVRAIKRMVISLEIHAKITNKQLKL